MTSNPTKATPAPKTPRARLRLTPAEAADYLGCTLSHIKYLRLTRQIPFYALSRNRVVIDRRDADAYLAARRVEAIHA